MPTNQRICVDLGTTTPVGKIRVVNHHNHATWEAIRGVRNTRIYVTAADPSAAYNANVSADALVFDGQVSANDYSNGGATWQDLALSRSLRGRYVVFDFATNWGATDVMCVRRIEIGS